MSKEKQRGGFAMGLIVGLLLGLGIALGVALYVTKAPVPFVNKLPQRTAEQDAQEAERNKNWDPNAPLAGRAGAKAASGVVTPAPAPTTPAQFTARLRPPRRPCAASTAASTLEAPATIVCTNRSCPGTSINANRQPSHSKCEKPSSIVMPRRFSSGSRSTTAPVSARTRADLP